MACPTCDHTMEGLGPSPVIYFWCPRCGTILNSQRNNESTAPKLVERSREFVKTTNHLGKIAMELVQKWIQIGLDESVNPPGENQGRIG